MGYCETPFLQYSTSFLCRSFISCLAFCLFPSLISIGNPGSRPEDCGKLCANHSLRGHRVCCNPCLLWITLRDGILRDTTSAVLDEFPLPQFYFVFSLLFISLSNLNWQSRFASGGLWKTVCQPFIARAQGVLQPLSVVDYPP
ncbi:hypothetical protein BDR26DRAFT_1009987 [Obelidium mucronatum]|nr:hypothetical protein BDR26DRAFT_1009987 [Obelidium mucronatum]